MNNVKASDFKLKPQKTNDLHMKADPTDLRACKCQKFAILIMGIFTVLHNTGGA